MDALATPNGNGESRHELKIRQIVDDRVSSLSCKDHSLRLDTLERKEAISEERHLNLLRATENLAENDKEHYHSVNSLRQQILYAIIAVLVFVCLTELGVIFAVANIPFQEGVGG